jgi:hypothetical protein
MGFSFVGGNNGAQTNTAILPAHTINAAKFTQFQFIILVYCAEQVKSADTPRFMH